MIGRDGAAEVMAAVVKAALGGDMRAADILLRRLWPERKGRPVSFELGPMDTAGDLLGAAGAVLRAVGAGDLSPEEGQAIAAIIELQRRTIETGDLAERIAAIEAKQEGGMRYA